MEVAKSCTIRGPRLTPVSFPRQWPCPLTRSLILEAYKPRCQLCSLKPQGKRCVSRWAPIGLLPGHLGCPCSPLPALSFLPLLTLPAAIQAQQQPELQIGPRPPRSDLLVHLPALHCLTARAVCPESRPPSALCGLLSLFFRILPLPPNTPPTWHHKASSYSSFRNTLGHDTRQGAFLKHLGDSPGTPGIAPWQPSSRDRVCPPAGRNSKISLSRALCHDP